MSKVLKSTGDFGFPSKMHYKTQIVGIYDLVGYTDLTSNRDLVNAVRSMETELELKLSEEYWWGDKQKGGGKEKPTNNVLLRSTGDGYIVAFSEGLNDLRALQYLVDIHNRIKKIHPVRLGINKGQNYVLGDLNDFTNIIGWGINVAARALEFAEANQIICTSHFAEPLLESPEEQVNEENMIELGTCTVKNMELRLFNFHKEDEFGAPATAQQLKSVKTPKKRKRKVTKKKS